MSLVRSDELPKPIMASNTVKRRRCCTAFYSWEVLDAASQSKPLHDYRKAAVDQISTMRWCWSKRGRNHIYYSPIAKYNQCLNHKNFDTLNRTLYQQTENVQRTTLFERYSLNAIIIRCIIVQAYRANDLFPCHQAAVHVRYYRWLTEVIVAQ